MVIEVAKLTEHETDESHTRSTAAGALRPPEGDGWADLLADGRAARLVLISLGIWLNAADALVTSTIMPSVGRDLGGYAYFSWATAAYMTGAILSGATAAWFASWFGLRRAMIVAGVIAAIGCGVSAIAPEMVSLVGGRLLQGVGAGWIVGGSYALIGALFPERHLARVFGVMTSIWGVATVLGPLIGGVFADGNHWRALFWMFAAQCILFVGASLALLPKDAPPARQGAPWLQLALVLASVFAIGAADLVGSALAASALAGCSLALLLSAVRMRSYRPGLFPRNAAEFPTVIGAAYLSYFALTAAAMGFSVYGPALLQRLYGLSPLVAGYAAGLEALGWTVAALAVSGLHLRWHPRVIRLGAGCIVGSLGALIVVMREGPLAAILATAALLGAGFGFTSGFTSRMVIASAEETERELASAGINSVRQVGSATGACLAGIIANLLGMTEGVTQQAAQSTAVWLFAAAVPVALVGAAGSWRVAALSRTTARAANPKPAA